MTNDEKKLLVDGLAPDEAMSLYHAMQEKFGWAGTVFQREDVDSAAGRDLTDEEWEKVQDSYEWCKGVPERTTERGWDVIYSLVDELGLKGPDQE